MERVGAQRMSFETLLVAVRDRVATITVNRPDKRNALSAAVRRELLQALEALRQDDEVRVVVFTGAGDKAFIAGADIAEFAERTPLEQRQAMDDRRPFDQVAAFPKPTIAMINGYCLGGGCELAIACDLRVAARSARLGQPEIKLGILPGGGGTQRLPRLVGFGRAMRLILTGEMVGAEEAERIGLVDLVVDDDALAARTRELAALLASYSPVALRLAKDAVRAALEMPLSAGLRYERELFVTAFTSEDKQEGVRAFLEKRAPEFRGR
ncbi:MAG: enoyl-CoA hydratase/isomerase family protein [Gemmatimonadetes bacterium]|nr:enoyl-CoA hydratase/isomerase family protein [Gemmatimonadota bacterium]